MVDKTTRSHPFGTGPYPEYGFNLEDQFVPLVSVSETHTFSPTVINEFRYGRASQEETRTCPSISKMPREFGINMDLAGPKVPPGINITGRLSLGAGTNCSWTEGGTNWQITDHVSWVRGRHSFKFGGEYYFRETHLKHDNNDGASFTFDGSTARRLASQPPISCWGS